MNVDSIRNRSNKVYSDLSYNIPINNDRCHEGFLSGKIAVERVVQQKKQIDKMMHGIIKERLFSNFISDQTRLSDENYINIDEICRDTTNKRVKPRFKSLNRTIETSMPMRRLERTEYQVQDISKTACFFRQNRTGADSRVRRSNRLEKELRKLPSIEIALTSKMSMNYDRPNTMKTIKADKNYQTTHHKKLFINQKDLAEFIRKWLGANSVHLINDVRLTRDLVYSKTKHMVDPKYLERFFYFFGFANHFGFRQYISLIDSAANTSLKFIHFWVFTLIDENNNGSITMQELFKFMQKFGESTYIEEEIYTFARWLQKNSKRIQDGQGPPEEVLAANRNLRLQELKQMLKQTTKQIIEVNCVKNTCYHQTIWSLQHEHQERVKMSQIQNNHQTTEKMKNNMLERKKRLQNQPGLRLRDFYTIFGNRRPKIFCYIIHLLTNLKPQEYQ